MTRVSIDDLDAAIEWLRSYEGEGDETERAMFRVADMLDKMAQRRAYEASARELSRKYGHPYSETMKKVRAGMRANVAR